MNKRFLLTNKEMETSVIEGIKELISGEVESISLKECSPQKAISICENAGLDVHTNDMEINGWELDYWIPCVDINDRKYTLSGTAYNGDADISRDE